MTNEQPIIPQPQPQPVQENPEQPVLDPTLEWFLSHCHIRKYQERATVVHGGEKAETLYYILSGTVIVLVKDFDGKEMILSYLSDNEFFGEAGLFDNGNRRTAWVRTRGLCRIAEISYRKFRQLVNINPDILMLLAQQLSTRLQNTSRQACNLAFLDVTGRIARTILHLTQMPEAMTHPDGMQIRITRQEIGQMVGCSRETVGRILKLLEEERLIEAHGKTLVVFDVVRPMTPMELENTRMMKRVRELARRQKITKIL